MKAQDMYASDIHYDKPVPEKQVPQKERLTAGVLFLIEFGIGSRIMLRRNLSLTDGMFMK